MHALSFLTPLLRPLNADRNRPGATTEMRRILHARGNSFQQLQEALSSVIPSIIAISFTPSGSQNHVDAVLVDICERLVREKQASSRNSNALQKRYSDAIKHNRSSVEIRHDRASLSTRNMMSLVKEDSHSHQNLFSGVVNAVSATVTESVRTVKRLSISPPDSRAASPSAAVELGEQEPVQETSTAAARISIAREDSVGADLVGPERSEVIVRLPKEAVEAV